MKTEPYLIKKKVIIEKHYNPKYGDDRLCKCGHPYHRHFDGYDGNAAVGCKYCQCYEFEPAEGQELEINYIVKTNGFDGDQTHKCHDEADVWEAIGRGWRYEVSSPTGKSVEQFIPF